MRQTQIDHGRNFIKLKSFIHFGSWMYISSIP
jgi:hypothetical protein